MLFYFAALDTREEKDKFIWLYETYRKRMWYIAFGILKDPYYAEDIVHDTFMKVSKNIDKFIGKDRNESGRLIVTIVKRLSLDALKRRKHFEFLPVEDEILFDDKMENDPVDMTVSKEQYERLVLHFASVDERYAGVLKLKLGMGCSNKEISEILDISEENVRLRFHRARRKLMSILREEEAVYGE